MMRGIGGKRDADMVRRTGGKRDADIVCGIVGYDVWNCLKYCTGQQADGGIGI